MESISFDTIISGETHYGIVWKGTYKREHDCVIKVVLLDTGIHYDKQKKEYRDGDKKISSSKAKRYFDENDEEPYLHELYRKRKAMSIEKFKHEVKMIRNMSDIGFAPKLYEHWIDSKSYRVHYGFIVMERMTTTVKKIILRRDLSSSELKDIKSKIRKLHDNNVKHGDLKPSNIGVHLDERGRITVIRMIDWAKGQYTSEQRAYDRDNRTFVEHIEKNIGERK